MGKNYFEMNDKERQLRHIADFLDYAIAMLGEGLSGTGKYKLSSVEVGKLQSDIADKLLDADKGVRKLLKALEEN